MTTPRPDDHRVTGHGIADQAGMDTVTLRLPRWPILLRLLGRSPLVRKSDRIEALVLVLAVVVSLLAAPVAGAVGTAVHDSRRHVHAEQAQTHHTVTATVTDGTAAQQISRTNTITVQARWSAAGAEHTGAVEAPSSIKTGDPVEIWVDHTGSQVDTPSTSSRAAVDAVTAALVIWASVVAVAATVFAGTRALCDRIRFTGWQHDLDNLVGHGGGHTNRQP
jgi:hypothetical protein